MGLAGIAVGNLPLRATVYGDYREVAEAAWGASAAASERAAVATALSPASIIVPTLKKPWI